MSIPNDIRTPLCFIEFDNSKAVTGTTAMTHKVLLMGQMLSSGTAETAKLYPFNSGDEAGALWGRGSLMHAIAAWFKESNAHTEVMGVALPEAFNQVDKDYNAAVKTDAVDTSPTITVEYKDADLDFNVDENTAAIEGWTVTAGGKTSNLVSFDVDTGFMVIVGDGDLAISDLVADTAMTIGGKESVPAGVAASGPQTIIGTAQEDALMNLIVAGVDVSVLVSKGDDAAAIASAIVDVINGNDDLPVTATAASAVITYTAKNTGETGNEIKVVCNYYAGQSFPLGVTTQNIQLSGGAGNPDVTFAISAMADEWFNHIVMPYKDKTNLDALRDELLERWGPMKMEEGTAYLAFSGTHAETSTFGESRNDFLYSCMGANDSPTPAYLWATDYAAQASYELAIDPARPLQTLVMPRLLPVEVSKRWDQNERNLHLYDGVATHKVDAGGNVQIEREITMYRLNDFGRPDPSYLDLTTPHTLGYIRYATVNRITQKFPRHKLADDGQSFDPTQPVVTPSILNIELVSLYQEMLEQAIVENVDNYKEALYCERDKNDKNRVNVFASPDLVNQFRVFAMTNQFIL
ncbi:phage tail sheath subtilisin-like domain-containing protein [Vibrio paucivorans]